MTQTETQTYPEQTRAAETKAFACDRAILALKEQMASVERRTMNLRKPELPDAPEYPILLPENKPGPLRLPDGPEKTKFVDHPDERDLKRAGCWVTPETTSLEEPELWRHALSCAVPAALTVTVLAADASLNPALPLSLLHTVIACNALGLMILTGRFVIKQRKYDKAIRAAGEAALQKSAAMYMTKKKAAEDNAQKEYEQLCRQLREMHENDEARYRHNIKVNADCKEEYDRKMREYPHMLAMHQRAVKLYDDACLLYEAIRQEIGKSIALLLEVRSRIEEKQPIVRKEGLLYTACCDRAAAAWVEDAVQAMHNAVSNVLEEIDRSAQHAQQEMANQMQSVCDEYNRAVDTAERRSDNRYRELMAANARAEEYMSCAADKLRGIHEGVVTSSMMQYLTMNECFMR